MKHIARILFLPFCIFLVAGCAGGVLSKNLVGLEDYRLDPEKIDGTWIGDGGALLLKTVDRNKGILKVIVLEDPGDTFSLKEGPIEVRILKGKSGSISIYCRERMKRRQRMNRIAGAG